MTSAADAAAARSRRRIAIPTLFTLAVIVGFFACFAVWVNRQVLNTDNWTKTSGDLLANRQINEALSAYVVTQLFSSVNVEKELKSKLPSQAQALAGPAAAGLRLLADRAVPELLATTPVQEAWRNANKTAHAEFLRILHGGGKVLSTKAGVVKLDLHELVTQLADQLGVGSQLAAVRSKLSGATGASARAKVQERLGVTLPPASGELVIMRSSQLKTVQNIATGIRGLAIVLPLISLALFALAVWLSEGRRRVALRTTGWCFFGTGILLLFARRLAGDQVVNGLVANPSNRTAAHAAWSIGTSLLYDIAVALLLYGLVLVAAAWLAGRTRPALFVRRALAPWLREHEVAAYATAGGILLLIVLWGPTPATHEVLPVIGFAALFALGVYLLRRDTAREFPDAKPGEAVAELRRRISAGRSWRTAGGTARDGVAPGARAAGASGGDRHGAEQSRLEVLERLTNLHERGALTDEEFASEKSLVIGKS
jgi:hypothetical protein